MKLRELKTLLEVTPGLSIGSWALDMSAPDPVLVILGRNVLGDAVQWFMRRSAVYSVESACQLVSVLLGQRDPQVMFHMTRIVGYYSKTNNWNASKLAELRDRHEGNYEVPAVAA
jgi:hypothetical protein